MVFQSTIGIIIAAGGGEGLAEPVRRKIAQSFQAKKLATLLINLLAADELETGGNRTGYRVEIQCQTDRLLSATDWLLMQADINDLSIGYLGSDIAGAAALVAATKRPSAVRAIVMSGGQPDLAGMTLPDVRAPTLLVVGGKDLPAIASSRLALLHFRTERRLEIVAGADFGFEEPEALRQVCDSANEWFMKHLTSQDRTV